MNAITHAINHVRSTVPQQILELTFGQKNVTEKPTMWHQSTQHQSIDHVIRQRVIDPRVNADCNLYGGTEVAIDLRDVPFEQPNHRERVFRIPFEKTNGLYITSVKHLSYLHFHGGNISGYNTGNQQFNAMEDLYRAVASMPIVHSADCQIIGDNTILVRDDTMRVQGDYALVCLVANDPNMNNIQPGLFPLYSQMVELAVKNYIYINLDVNLDRGFLVGGMDLGRIRQIVDNYADAHEMYMELLTTRWQSGSFTNDRPRMNKFIQSMIPRG